MRDADVRSALGNRLPVWHPEPDALVVDELDLMGQVRVDVAVINGAMWGYEIKSARDTLRRLPRQVELYSRVLDFAALVVADNHLESGMGLVPSWWEVIVVGGVADRLVVERVRPGTDNPEIDPSALVQLLWRDEAIGLLADRGLDRGVRSKPRRFAWDRLVEHLEPRELKAAVRQRLTTRPGWRGRVSPE